MLVAAGRAEAHQMRKTLEKIEKALETSGATRLLTAIDVCHTRLAASIVGIFSLYRSRLRSIYGWEKPLDEVRQLLLKFSTLDLTEQFEKFRLAVNVLKHGTGASHTKLLARAERPPFRVQAKFGDLHEEGDCCPPSDLVLVSAELLERGCDAIEKSSVIIETAMGGWHRCRTL